MSDEKKISFDNLSEYRCCTCTREDCPIWITKEDRLRAQTGGVVRTHILVAVSESVGLACHSKIQQEKAQYESAVSGLKYDVPGAAGSIAAIWVGGRRYPLCKQKKRSGL
jgi:hypothetical protein